MQPKDNFNFSYIARPSQRLQLFSELKGNKGGSEFLAGSRLKFKEGVITGYMTSSGKAHATYSKALDMIKMEFNT